MKNQEYFENITAWMETEPNKVVTELCIALLNDHDPKEIEKMCRVITKNFKVLVADIKTLNDAFYKRETPSLKCAFIHFGQNLKHLDGVKGLSPEFTTNQLVIAASNVLYFLEKQG